jgi:hypothetical protein
MLVQLKNNPASRRWRVVLRVGSMMALVFRVLVRHGDRLFFRVLGSERDSCLFICDNLIDQMAS